MKRYSQYDEPGKKCYQLQCSILGLVSLAGKAPERNDWYQRDGNKASDDLPGYQTLIGFHFSQFGTRHHVENGKVQHPQDGHQPELPERDLGSAEVEILEEIWNQRIQPTGK